MCIWCLFTTQISFVILCQISAACSESWHRKLKFLCHFILVLLSSTLMKQVTCSVGIISLILWIFSCRDLFQVTGTDASCIYIICSQFITFEQVTLCSSYCAWFVALLTPPYAVLLRTCPYLILTQFDSSVYIRIQFELLWPVQSWHWGQWSCHFIYCCPYCWHWR